MMKRSPKQQQIVLVAPLVALVGAIIVIILTTYLVISRPNRPQSIVNSKISDLQIWTQFPAMMELNQSYVIETSLVPTKGRTFISDILVENATAIATNPTPVGTPDSTLQNAFGPGYEPFATATLYAGTFKVVPTEPQERSLRQSKVVWDWNITPQEPGKQVISEEIEIKWKPSQNGGNGISTSYVIGNPQISVQVNAPFDWRTVITSVLEFVLGGALLALVTWLSTQLWKLLSKRSKNKLNKRSVNIGNKRPSKPSKRKH